MVLNIESCSEGRKEGWKGGRGGGGGGEEEGAPQQQPELDGI